MSKLLFDNFLNQQVGTEKALVTMFEPLAARVGAMEYADMLADPALWGANLAKTGRLLGMDALVMGFDSSIATAACQQLETPTQVKEFEVLLEAFDRLAKTEQASFGCVASMTGPVTLAEETSADVKQATVEMAEALCKSRPSILLMREGAALGQATVGMPQRKAYNTIKNMAAYYSVPLGIYLEDYNSTTLSDLQKLKVPFVFLGTDMDGKLPLSEEVKSLAEAIDGVGVPLDFKDAVAAKSQAGDYAETLAGENILFTNAQELDSNTDLEALLALIGDLREIGS